LTTCGRSSLPVPAKSVRGLRPMSTPRSSVITSPNDRRSTPSTGRGTGTGSCGSGAPHRRQVALLGGLTCPLGQSSPGTTGTMRSGGEVIATKSERSLRLTVDPESCAPGSADGVGCWYCGSMVTVAPDPSPVGGGPAGVGPVGTWPADMLTAG